MNQKITYPWKLMTKYLSVKNCKCLKYRKKCAWEQFVVKKKPEKNAKNWFHAGFWFSRKENPTQVFHMPSYSSACQEFAKMIFTFFYTRSLYLSCLVARGNSGAARPYEVHFLRFSPLPTGCLFPTVSVGFHFAKTKV